MANSLVAQLDKQFTIKYTLLFPFITHNQIPFKYQNKIKICVNESNI